MADLNYPDNLYRDAEYRDALNRSARLYRETSEIAAAQDAKLDGKPDGKPADPVHEPAHYKRGAIECIDYIRESLGPDGFEAYCIGNVIKYVSRYRDKGGVQDLDKAKVYLGWAIETIHRGPSAVVRDTLPPNLAAACRHPMAAEADRIADAAPLYVENAYAMGWRRSALWAERDDLIADIDSPAFYADRAKDLFGVSPDDRP